MRQGLGSAALSVAGVMACSATPGPARAFDWWDALTWDTVFASVDMDRTSTFLTTGGKKSFALPDEGTRAFLMGTSGLSLSDVVRARRGKMLFTRIERQQRLLIGIDRSLGPVYASFGLGPSQAVVPQPGRGPRVRYGLAADASVWLRPDPSLYVALAAGADTANASLWGRARLGWRPAGSPVAFGPELMGSVERTTGKTRLGLHVGEPAFLSRFDVTLSAGWQWDQSRRSSHYLTATLLGRY